MSGQRPRKEIMSLRIGLDIDGVLADFRGAFSATANDVLGPRSADAGPLSPAEVERVWQHIARLPNWWLRLAPFEPAQIAELYSLSRAARWETFFMTARPPSAGDAVQFQTQWWLEQQGFYLPSVLTVHGSRGEIANALRLDIVVDDQFANCAEIIGGSVTKALLMLRDPEPVLEKHALDRGVGVVTTLEETLPVLARLQDLLQTRRGRVLRLTDWISPPFAETLPDNPRITRKVPDVPAGS